MFLFAPLLQVAELKRVNNLIRDQDFYALQTIKVPIKAHSLYAEIIEEETNQQKQASGGAISNGPSKLSTGASIDTEEYVPNDNIGSETDYDLTSESEETKNRLVVRTLSIRDSFRKNSQSKEAQDFLCRMDADINRIVASTVSRKENLRDVTSTLTCKRIQPLRADKSVMWGADCGIRWWSMVVMMLLVGLAAPLIIFVLYESSHHVYENTNSSSLTTMTQQPDTLSVHNA